MGTGSLHLHYHPGLAVPEEPCPSCRSYWGPQRQVPSVGRPRDEALAGIQIIAQVTLQTLFLGAA